MIYSNQLGKLLKDINSITRRNGGIHLIFVRCANEETMNLKPETPSEVHFVSDDEYENGFELFREDMCELTTVSLAQEVVSAALYVKSDATETELVISLSYYLERDAFYDFDE